MTSNTITIRLRRPKAEIEAKARPNVNAWVNQLIEQALGPRNVDWANISIGRPATALFAAPARSSATNGELRR